MFETNVIQTINALEFKVFKRFTQFAHSPYHNRSEKVTALVDYLFSNRRKLNEVSCSVESLGRLLHLTGKTSVNRLRQILSETKSLLRQFIIIEGLQEDRAMRLSLESKGTRALGIWEYRSEELERRKDKAYSNWNADEYYALYQIERDFLIRISVHLNSLRKRKKHFNKVMRLIETTHDCAKREMHCFGIQIGADFDQNWKPNHRDIHTWQTIQELVEEPTNMEKFENLMSIRSQGGLKANRKLEETALVACLNFMIRYYSKEPSIEIELWALYQEVYHKGYLFRDGILGANDFRNMCMHAYRQESRQWFDNFFDETSKELSDLVRDEVVAITKCDILMKENRFDEIVDCLNTAQFEDTGLTIQGKCYEIIAHFGLENLELQDHLIRNFLEWTRTHKGLRPSERKRFSKFAKQAAKILKLFQWYYARPTNAIKRLSALRTAINADSSIANRGMLSKTIRQFLERKGASPTS